MIGAGQRNERISFERAAASTNALGHELEAAWSVLTGAWAQVLMGSGQERREAAVQGSSQVATFTTLRTTSLLAVTVRDRIAWRGLAWDIASIAPDPARQTIAFTAVARGV